MPKRRSLKRQKPKWKADAGLLHQPQIPKPMHGVSPRTVLGQAWWNKERRAAYASTDFHCLACGVFKFNAKVKQHLEGHECYLIDYELGRMEYERTVPLCHLCHSYIHRGRLQMLVDSRKITHAKYQTVVHHGESVLTRAGLSTVKPVYNGPIAEWSDWRLVIGGDEYPPKFKTEQDWIVSLAFGNIS